VNANGVDAHAPQIRPRSLSLVVYFVPDAAKSEAFYVERLGFRCTDRFVGVGPLLQPSGTLDHHTHFFIGAPAFMGVEHFTFHFAGPNEVMQNGPLRRSYQAFWGPGATNSARTGFWYFNSRSGATWRWTPTWTCTTSTGSRAGDLEPASQVFLLRHRAKWMPGPGTPETGDYA
jgi:catechol 2,3-dioxygenase-like lactoylglutathione lyase family enzyme